MEQAAAANIEGQRLGRDMGADNQSYEYLRRVRIERNRYAVAARG